MLIVLLVLAISVLIGAVVIVQAQTQPAPQEGLQADTAICSSSFCIAWQVVAGGVGRMASDSFRLQATLGQTMAGLFSGDAYEVEAGYWAGVNRGDRSYLPVTIE